MRNRTRVAQSPVVAFLLCLCALPSRSTGAQMTVSSVATPGLRVRVHSAGQPDRVATVISMTTDTLVARLESGGTASIPVALTTGYDVSAGERAHKALGAGIGALSGAALGF